MRNKKQEDYVEMIGGSPFCILEATMKIVSDPVVIYDYPITGTIGDVDKYRNIFDVLHNATEQDVAILHITTPGGDLHTAQKICAEIEAASCTVVGIVVGECASAGTLIALACDEINIDPDSNWLFHTMTYGTDGMAPHIEAHVEHSKGIMTRLCERHYKGILTEHEVKDLLRGDQLWMFGDEAKKRIDALQQQEAQTVDAEDTEQNLEDMSVEELEDLLEQINYVLCGKIALQRSDN